MGSKRERDLFLTKIILKHAEKQENQDDTSFDLLDDVIESLEE